RGAVAGDNPWDAPTLEWATSSPAPTYNFLRFPIVRGRYPIWARTGSDPIVTGQRTDAREIIVSDVLDAQPKHRVIFPSDSIWPFLASLALGVMFAGMIFTQWAVPVGLVLTTITLIGWFWPNKEEKMEEAREDVSDESRKR
ncbi:MAG: cytochrome c oxidase subunit 4, partial [Limisphaerales bacterium]